MVNLRDALIEAGASEEKARLAAEEVAEYEGHITAVRADIAALKAYVDQQIAAVRADIAALRSYVDLRLERVEGRLNLLTWMVGFVIAIQVAMFVKLFVHG